MWTQISNNFIYRHSPVIDGLKSLMYMQQVKLKPGCGRTWRNWQQGESRATTTVRQSLRNTSTPQVCSMYMNMLFSAMLLILVILRVFRVQKSYIISDQTTENSPNLPLRVEGGSRCTPDLLQPLLSIHCFLSD